MGYGDCWAEKPVSDEWTTDERGGSDRPSEGGFPWLEPSLDDEVGGEARKDWRVGCCPN